MFGFIPVIYVLATWLSKTEGNTVKDNDKVNVKLLFL